MSHAHVQERVHGVRALGFTLIEIVVVLIIVSVLIAMAAAMTRGGVEIASRKLTDRALDTATTALSQFVTVARRLPCPADGALAPTDPNAGRERRTAGACDANQARGVLPWATLGLREDDVLDGYGGLLTYRAGADLVADDALMMAACDAAGLSGAVTGAPGRCNPACVDGTIAVPTQCTRIKDVLTGRGLRVQRSDGVGIADPAADPPTGAAYVLLSHGPNKGGSYGRSGVAQEALATLSAAETANGAANALAAFYVSDDGIDDRVVFPSILAVTQQAAMAPRPHKPF
jgi:prepilin-type N-terminal cleavage/methylation domain-containing protein